MKEVLYARAAEPDARYAQEQLRALRTSQQETISTLQAGPTMMREVEQLRHFLAATSGMSRIWESTIRSTKLVEERVNHGLDGGETLGRGVLQESRDQLNCIWSRFAEDLDTD